jgi:heme-degrading monooxygenase HmoA
MVTTIAQHKVKDYANWKQVYDSQVALRTSSGMLSDHIYRDASDPNNIAVIINWNSLETAQKFFHSPELKAAMEKSGVLGQANFSFLNDVNVN